VTLRVNARVDRWPVPCAAPYTLASPPESRPVSLGRARLPQGRPTPSSGRSVLGCCRRARGRCEIVGSVPVVPSTAMVLALPSPTGLCTSCGASHPPASPAGRSPDRQRRDGRTAPFGGMRSGWRRRAGPPADAEHLRAWPATQA